MKTRQRGAVDYIIRRPGTRSLYFRYQFPRDTGGGERKISLETSDWQIARVKAAKLLVECDKIVKVRRAELDSKSERRPRTTLKLEYEDGIHKLSDGSTLFVDGWLRARLNGKSTKSIEIESNVTREITIGEGMTLAEYEDLIANDMLFENEIGGIDCPGWRGENVQLPKNWIFCALREALQAPADGSTAKQAWKRSHERKEFPYRAPTSEPIRKRKGADDEHLERWIAHKKISGYLEREARAVWQIFRELTHDKPLKDCNRDDGRKLAKHYLDAGNKTATVKKKISHVSASVNLAIQEGHLRYNPFVSVIPKLKDSKRRKPMTDEDVTLIRENKHQFDREEWLLYMLCATTGMRREEAHSIQCDFREHGVRFVMVGKKTEQSERRVPLPDSVIPLLPDPICGPLFEKNLKNLGREVLRQMERIGVQTPGLHSLRHRAKDRLRAAGVRHEEQEELLGHNEKTVADGYGKGYPVAMLKVWIEHIGF